MQLRLRTTVVAIIRTLSFAFKGNGKSLEGFVMGKYFGIN